LVVQYNEKQSSENEYDASKNIEVHLVMFFHVLSKKSEHSGKVRRKDRRYHENSVVTGTADEIFGFKESLTRNLTHG